MPDNYHGKCSPESFKVYQELWNKIQPIANELRKAGVDFTIAVGDSSVSECSPQWLISRMYSTCEEMSGRYLRGIQVSQAGLMNNAMECFAQLLGRPYLFLNKLSEYYRVDEIINEEEKFVSNAAASLPKLTVDDVLDKINKNGGGTKGLLSLTEEEMRILTEASRRPPPSDPPADKNP